MPKAEQNIDGLTLMERRWLAEIRMTGDWKQAAANVGLTHRQALAFFKKAPFKAEYDKIYDSEEVKVAERELAFLSGDAVSILGEAAKAELTKKVDCVCPSCQTKFSVFTNVMDWATKLRAVEFLLKGANVVKDQKSLKVEGGITITNLRLSAGELLALEAMRAGRPIPEQMMRRLEELSRQGGFDLPALPAGKVVEAEYRVVPNTEG